MRQNMLVIGRSVGGEGRYGDGAGGHDRMVRDQPLRPVLRDQRDAVAGCDPDIDQAARQQADLPAGVAIAERPIGAVFLAPEEGFAGQARGLLEEHLRQAAQCLIVHPG